MFKNYFKVGIRTFKSQKLISVINIFGLAIGIAINLLIFLYIQDETSFDTEYDDYQNIYRVESVFQSENNVDHWAASSGLLKAILDDKFPEVKSSVRLTVQPSVTVKVENQKFKEKLIRADKTINDVFGFSYVKGNPKDALNSPSSVVLTKRIAKKYFGSTDVLGKTILIQGEVRTITGIIADRTRKTHLIIDILIPLNNFQKTFPDMFTEWTNLSFYTYTRVKPNVDVANLSAKLSATCYELGAFDDPDYFQPTFHAINSIHLDGNSQYEISKNSYWIYIYIFATIGLLILILSSINYVNLTTSSSLNRAKEIAIRKTLGALKKNLIIQFLAESMITATVAFIMAIFMVLLVIPLFNSITGKELSFMSFMSPTFIFASFGIALLVGLLSGLYPAFILSSFKPANIIKGGIIEKRGSKFSFGLKKSLIILQFVISIFLLTSSLVVIDQISFMFDKPLGFDDKNVMVIPFQNVSSSQLQIFKSELENNSAVDNVAFTSSVPGNTPYRDALDIGGIGNINFPYVVNVDPNYFKVMDMEIIKGRDFNEHIKTDVTTSFIINEAAAKAYGWIKNPINRKIQYAYNDSVKNGVVIGVIKDFHQESQHKTIEPIVFQLNPIGTSFMVIKYKNSSNIETLENTVKVAWEKHISDDILGYSILENDLQRLYKEENTMKQLLITFSLLAIFISTLGLFALVTYSTKLRMKEIVIRKILGATNQSIILELSKEYIVLIFISMIIAIPLSYYLLNLWLSGFAFRVDISVVTVLLAISLILLVALVTLVGQGLKAALGTPINSFNE